MKSPRIAARAVLMHQDRLLLVNAWPSEQSDLWCAPGGGVEPHSSLPDNLARELFEETGLTVTVGAPCLVNEFHDRARDFHQIEIFFRCTVGKGALDHDWADPEGIVTKRRFFSQAEIASIRLKPASLPRIAWGDEFCYDPLEPILR